jgi:hypothetical protein
MQQTYPVRCAKCRRALDISDAFCRACGADQGANMQQASIAVVNSAPEPPTETICPSCSGISAQRVSGIVSAGAWNTATVGGFVGAVGTTTGHSSELGGITGSQSAGATVLARRLAPPQRPGLDISNLTIAIIFIAGFGIALWALGKFAHGTYAGFAEWPWDVAALCFVIGAVAMVGPAGRERERMRRDHRQADEEWTRRSSTWMCLYYCSRCDIAFNPDTGRLERPDALSALLS